MDKNKERTKRRIKQLKELGFTKTSAGNYDCRKPSVLVRYVAITNFTDDQWNEDMRLIESLKS